MHIFGNILQFFGARLAEFVAIGFFLFFSFFSKRKADKVSRRIEVFFLLIVFGAILAAVPVSVVFLVTNGDLSLLNVGRPGGWADRAAIGCDLLILVFLIVVPSQLRHRIP